MVIYSLTVPFLPFRKPTIVTGTLEVSCPPHTANNYVSSKVSCFVQKMDAIFIDIIPSTTVRLWHKTSYSTISDVFNKLSLHKS